tara:strand:- start:281 stop:2554 length:2274 start_codon:yes stop_codon:yes gene_type:complete
MTKKRTYLGPKILAPFIGVAFVISIIIVSTQLYLSHSSKLAQNRDRLGQLQRAISVQLESSLSLSDNQAVNFLLSSTSQLPEVDYVELIDHNQRLFSYGEPWVRNPIELRQNIRFQPLDTNEVMQAKLRIISSGYALHSELWQSAVWLIAANLFKLIVISVLFLTCFNAWVTQRLHKARQALYTPNPTTASPPVASPTSRDEVSDIFEGIHVWHQRHLQQQSEHDELHRQANIQSQLLFLQREFVSYGTSSEQVESALTIAIERICTLFQWPAGHIYRVCPVTKSKIWSTKLWYLNGSHVQQLQRLTDKTPLKEGDENMPSQVLSQGRVLVYRLDEDTFGQRQTVFAELGVSHWIGIPIKAGRAVTGIIECYIKDQRLPNARLIEELAHVGVAVGQLIEKRRNQESHLSAMEEIKALKRKLQKENIYLQGEMRINKHFHQIIGQSEAIRQILAKADRTASTLKPVLISGETGTGKEFLARAIHEASPWGRRALVKLNCSALTAHEIERDLFGCEAGHLPESAEFRTGMLELSEDSTLFIDEIGEMPLNVQTKLVEALKDGKFRRLGSDSDQRTQCRVIAATSIDLELAVKLHRFRRDLFCIINGVNLELPPLRKRTEDVRPLVKYYADHYAEQLGKAIFDIPLDALTQLENYDWPGNIRELKNVVERSVLLSPQRTLLLPDFQEHTNYFPLSQVESLEELEKRHILEIVARCKGKLPGADGAAKRLGISVSELQARLDRYKNSELVSNACAAISETK